MADSPAPPLVNMEALSRSHDRNRVGNCWSDREAWPCRAWSSAETMHALHVELLTVSRQRDEALGALVDLLAVVNIAMLEDPSKHRVANTVGGPALVATRVLEKHGRLDALRRAVQDRHG